ncbi:hypothetical protein [Lactobacillus koreensis] [Lactiplantibacillus mudanjiangensis]|uniref:GyrI-like domain-containing protein n=1 Tax=Lactiplantibacillus mudanjiangensis TaxID=1296538 RepID=UPI001015186A|nr:GyrI-like domain-containing protein [Lactiplantibacillus mudanjiangensis]VDG20894.1 hypothetical protein [Lactobacillus koreensis] [Lactiplantibacillus mudanjiangensis]VDG31977.1 hypothetical protein [Lactobacillus koreensis] [Lactiplantibacillus mudanjiangensis]
MANYQIETKPAFAVLGLETTLTGDYLKMGQQKAAFWDQINAAHSLAALAGVNDFEFAVNESINGVLHYYAGRQIDPATVATTGQRLIEFPAGNYLVITATADDQMALYNALEGLAFGQILPTLTDYAYVGGPNTAVKTTTTSTGVSGEMWVPLVEK